MSATRQSTPAILANANTLKRAHSPDAESDADLETKRTKLSVENTPTTRDKKRRKKKKRKAPVVSAASAASSNGPETRESSSPSPISAKGKDVPSELVDETASAVNEPVVDEAPSVDVATLSAELSAQTILVKKHEALLAQLTQSITCQVCLDILHKPYSLSPCGHVACYNCLVQWFTSEPDHEVLGPRRKTCPHCRARIRERPAEAWSIKDMVAGLLKSGLVSGLSQGPPPPPELPGPPPEDDNALQDPWRNIFGFPYQHPRFQRALPNGEQPPIEDMGMLDVEDGGIYRCLDCMHEIWDGVCSACNRVYHGHRVGADFADMFDDGESLDGEDMGLFPHWFPMNLGDDDDESIRDLADGDDEEPGYESDFIDDGDGAAADVIEISDSEATPRRVVRRRAMPRYVESSDEDEARSDSSIIRAHVRRLVPIPRRYRSPESDDVVVLNDDSDSDSVEEGRRLRRALIDAVRRGSDEESVETLDEEEPIELERAGSDDDDEDAESRHEEELSRDSSPATEVYRNFGRRYRPRPLYTDSEDEGI
ncbi:RING-type domain-containing protein [Mycena kentingensis (nom. inval.)]|nr:RING-type domain-containing protein [Mycena kentingensis (nom. inval.)]